MFCALNGATRSPIRRRYRHNAVATQLLPTWEPVPPIKIGLAVMNGQDLRELGRSLANIFSRLAMTGDATPVEEIDVITDEQLAHTPQIAGFILPNMESL